EVPLGPGIDPSKVILTRLRAGQESLPARKHRGHQFAHWLDGDWHGRQSGAQLPNGDQDAIEFWLPPRRLRRGSLDVFEDQGDPITVVIGVQKSRSWNRGRQCSSDASLTAMHP